MEYGGFEFGQEKTVAISDRDGQIQIVSRESQSADRLSYVGDVAPRLAFM